MSTRDNDGFPCDRPYIQAPVSPTAAMLNAISAIAGTGHANDPEGLAMRAAGIATLIKTQSGQLDICPVTRDIDTAATPVAQDMLSGATETVRHLAETAEKRKQAAKMAPSI